MPLPSLGPSTPWLSDRLRCPATGSPLSYDDEASRLRSAEGRVYPVVDGIPMLIAEERSLFDLDRIVAPRRELAESGRPRRLAAAVARFVMSLPPTRTRNVRARSNHACLAALLRQRLAGGQRRTARVLVVGGRVLGAGMQPLLDDPAFELLETDVALGPRTRLVCDAHDLPFADGTFDAVVIQAVLESVLDPVRVASEVHRVLAPGGLVYSEAPFIQQVHEGALDLHRFTHLGHRRLWRAFDEVRSGAQCGPGMALLWSLEYFLQAFVGSSRPLRAAIARLTRTAAFWLKYFDDFLVSRPGGIDAASGTFFLGRRRETALGDRELVHAFRGVHPRGQRLPGAGPS